jgi:hypothetical protein
VIGNGFRVYVANASRADDADIQLVHGLSLLLFASM